MIVNGFNFHAELLLPSSGEMAQAWRPYVDACIESFLAPAAACSRATFRSTRALELSALFNAFKRLASGAQRWRSPICSPAPHAVLYRLGI